MQIELTDERQTDFKEQLKALFQTEFEADLSDFRADAVLALFLKTLGPAVYNQAVQDVRAHLQVRLHDLEGEVYADD